jgi:hypothetical protein
MKRMTGPTLIALALAAAFPAQAQSNEELLKELRALRDRVNELEKKLATQPAAPAGAAAAGGAAGAQWGMTPEQARELNRVTMKAEATEDNLEMQGFKGLTISGWMDPTFIYNQRQNRSGFQFLNGVGDDGYAYDNGYIGTVSLDFLKEMENGTKWRLTLMPNRGSESVMTGANRLVHEATVSIPLSDLNTRLIAGHMPDWSGYEYMQPTLNPLITHNLLFDFTLPTAYTGVGLDVTAGKWWMRGMIANVNTAQKSSSNETPSFVGRVDYSRGEFSGFGGSMLIGKVANFADFSDSPKDTTAILAEVDGWFTRGDLTLGGQISYGQQEGAAIAPDPISGELRDARWWGVSGLAGYKLTPRLQALVRADYINNEKNGGGLFGYTGYWDPASGSLGDGRNGIGVDGNLDCVTDATIEDCNRGANRYAVSFGLNYLFNENTTFKAEYRYDGADRAVFYDVRSGTYKKTNQLLGASVVVSF